MTERLLDDDEELAGEVAWVVYADRETGFGVVELTPEQGDAIRCAGPLSDLVEGQTVRVVGRWREHPRHGTTFETVFYEQLTPTTVAGLRAFLFSDDRFGEVPHAARERVLTAFGADAGRVIEEQPERLADEAGIAPDEATGLHEAWMAGRALAQLVRLVEPCGWPLEVARAVHARFGAASATLATQQPYDLLDAERVRFSHVDALARSLGVEPTDPRRLAAGARAAVAAARRGEGHQHLPEQVCVEEVARLLRVDALVAADGVGAAVDAGSLVREELDGQAVVTTPQAAATEQQLADGLRRLIDATGRLTHVAVDLAPADELTSGQHEAVRQAFAGPVSVLTGGPGTGKTRTVEEVVRAAEAHDLEVALCAPTGRAAKRLEELVGRPATTVHRLLEARPVTGGGFVFRYGQDERLPQDLVVVDEVSMCDTWLAACLVAAIDTGSHLLLVGDPDQLPSVGPGDVLADLLRSEVVPATRLTEIHRQAAKSRIVTLARELLDGDVGPLRGADGDVFLAAEAQRARIADRVVQTVAERAPAYFDVPVDDIQVLAPMYRGPAGVDALNTALKERLNPPAGRVTVAGFHEGDRVMQTRNDAELDVANGDVGRVVDLARREGTLRVAFPRGEVTYRRDDARHLTRAWAVTVHKAQGGEWPVVVLVCDRSQGSMLWRSLVYTAVTRARRALIIVGQAETLRGAARQQRARVRHTGLRARLVRPRRPRAG